MKSLEQMRCSYGPALDVMQNSEGIIYGYSHYISLLGADIPDWNKIADAFLNTRGWEKLSFLGDKAYLATKPIIDGYLHPQEGKTGTETEIKFSEELNIILHSCSDISLTKAVVLIAKSKFLHTIEKSNPFEISNYLFRAEELIDFSKSDPDLKYQALKLIGELFGN
jgi:hypothetical protein